jgi:diaminopimelate epimerase
MEFTKMHGLGNDFIIVENLDCSLKRVEELAIKVCDRHTGVGADGIIVVEKSQTADLKMRIFNSDGSEAEMCGNGIRCFSKYVYDRGIIDNKIIEIETLAGIIVSEVQVDNNNIMSIKVNMGQPVFEKEQIPFKGEDNNLFYTILVGDKQYKASTLLMGVPHTIVYVDNINIDEVINMGRRIERLAYFPKGTNINFVKIIDSNNIELRTFERGAGYTLACGTGTCASVVAANKNKLVNDKVNAKLAIGNLKIEFDGKNVTMEGPAEYICEGTLL